MSVHRRLRIAAVALWVMLLLGAVILWVAALNGSAPSSQLAATRFNGGSILFVAALVVIALRHVRPRRRMAIAIGAILLAAMIAPARAEPPGYFDHDNRCWVMNGSSYLRGGGPVWTQTSGDQDLAIQLHHSLPIGASDVGRCVRT